MDALFWIWWQKKLNKKDVIADMISSILVKIC